MPDADYVWLPKATLLTFEELTRVTRVCLGLGVPIATGVIEGACRHLVCDRLEITGARWRLERAEAILRLRALSASGDFDEYWQFHEAEEWRQNHASKYAGDLVPLAAESQAPRHLRLVQPPS